MFKIGDKVNVVLDGGYRKGIVVGLDEKIGGKIAVALFRTKHFPETILHVDQSNCTLIGVDLEETKN